MKNFTRSVLYSSTVLAAGLVAIFAIYSNVSTFENGQSIANISPAAGESSLGVNFGEVIDTSAIKVDMERTPEAIQSAMESSANALNNMVSAAGQEIPEVAIEAINATNEADAMMGAEESSAEDEPLKNIAD